MGPEIGTGATPSSERADVVVDGDRAAAERALMTAQRNSILSAEQACAVAHVYALLAIERRLADLCAVLSPPRYTISDSSNSIR